MPAGAISRAVLPAPVPPQWAVGRPEHVPASVGTTPRPCSDLERRALPGPCGRRARQSSVAAGPSALLRNHCSGTAHYRPTKWPAAAGESPALFGGAAALCAFLLTAPTRLPPPRAGAVDRPAGARRKTDHGSAFSCPSFLKYVRSATDII